jgi:hypothetical protein
MPVLGKREVTAPMKRLGRVLTETAAFTLAPLVHGGRLTLLSLLAGFTVTLPASIGSGVIYAMEIGIVRTSNSYIIQVANSSDIMSGIVTITGGTDDRCEGFAAASDSDTFTMNATTQGGLTIGDWFEFTDVVTNTWYVRAGLSGSGTLITPYSGVV